MQAKFLLVLPFILFFSYYPIIPLGSTENMNLEFSLPLIWLVLYSIISLPEMLSFLQHQGLKKSILLALFPAYLLISLIWSNNPLRTVLTAGIVTCLLISVCTFPGILKKHKGLVKQLISSLLISAVLVSAFCWLQCILDVAGLNRTATFLCQGCTYQAFGFPHPNGFAIEPQFMGSLLLAPITLSLYLLFTADANSAKRRYLLCSFFLIATLFLVFSRGAIYAFLAASAVAVIALIIKKPHSPRPLLVVPLILAAFVTALAAQGIFAELAPTNDNFGTAVAKSIHQLSLGKIDFRQPVTNPPASDNTPVDSSTTATEPAEPEPAETSRFSGYVAESTDYRLSLNEIALKTWIKNPRNILMGVGLGAAGPAMYETEPSLGSPKEIVQNEYISLLLEIGLFGIAALGIMIFAIISLYKTFSPRSKTPKNNRTELIFLGALVLSFLLSLNFFSGLPNALHIYLLVPLGFGALVAAKH